MFFVPWKSELLDGLLGDECTGESGATAASDINAAGIVGFAIQVLDVVVIPSVAAAGPVVASGKRPVVASGKGPAVAGEGWGDYCVVRAVVVDLVLPEWRGTGCRINVSCVANDQWLWAAFSVTRHTSSLGVITVDIEVHAA